MTYSETMTETNLSSTPTEAQPSTIDKLKTLSKEGTQRAKRINQILRAAFSETRAEFQEGRSVISPLAKEVTTEAVSSFKSTKQRATTTVSEAWQEGEGQSDLSDRLVAFIKSVSKTAQVELFPQLKKQALNLDNILTNRYGDQYTSFKSRFDSIRKWTAVNAPADASMNNQPDVVVEPDVVIEVDSETVR